MEQIDVILNFYVCTIQTYGNLNNNNKVGDYFKLRYFSIKCFNYLLRYFILYYIELHFIICNIIISGTFSYYDFITTIIRKNRKGI